MTVQTDMLSRARSIVTARLDELDSKLHEVNRRIYDNPELKFKEFIAHDTIADFLESLGYKVERSSWGLETAFDVCIGSGEKQIIFCAEYDALPGMGHACGHNLIATSSLGAFVGAAQAMAELGISGRLRLLGTPGEEGGGGKAELIKAGAFNPPESVLAAIMAHPTPSHRFAGTNYVGLGGVRLIAAQNVIVEFKGKPAHAGGEPWKGINALDAAVAGYNNVSMMRQQMMPEDKVHGVFEAGGDAPNVIPAYTRMNWIVRSPSGLRCKDLADRLIKCMEAGAMASGCEVTCKKEFAYKNLRINDGLCKAYVEEMGAISEKVLQRLEIRGTASTDMGNVSHLVPSFHGSIGVPTEDGIGLHNPRFTARAGTDAAHKAAIQAGKGMAMLAIRTFLDPAVAGEARTDFEKPDDP